jgi:hypothetical protein
MHQDGSLYHAHSLSVSSHLWGPTSNTPQGHAVARMFLLGNIIIHHLNQLFMAKSDLDSGYPSLKFHLICFGDDSLEEKNHVESGTSSTACSAIDTLSTVCFANVTIGLEMKRHL